MAAGTKVFSLFGDLSLNSGVFKKDIAQARTSLRGGTAQMNRSLAKLDRGFVSVGRRAKSLAGRFLNVRTAIGTLAGSAGLGLLVKQSIDAGDAIGKTADKLGVGVEALQELRFAAGQAGVDVNTFDLALQRFTRRAAEAAVGTGEAKDALAQMGIQLRDASGNMRATEDLLTDVGDAFTKVEDPAERLRLAFKLFDSEGAKLVNLLTKGSAGMNELRQRARDLGLVLREDLVRNAETTKDRLSELGQIIKINTQGAILEHATQIGQLAQAFADSIPKIVGFVTAFGKFAGLIERAPIEALEKELEALEKRLKNFDRLPDFFLLPFTREGTEADIASIKSMISALNRLKAAREFNSAGATPAPTALAAPAAVVPNPRDRGAFSFAPALKSAEESFKATAKFREEVEAVTRVLETDGERALSEWADRHDTLNKALDTGQIKQGEFNELIARSAELYAMQANAIDGAAENIKAATELGEAFGATLGGAFDDLIVQGKDFDDVLSSILKNLASNFLRQGSSELFGNIFGAFAGGGGAQSAGPSSGGGGGFGFGDIAKIGLQLAPLFLAEGGKLGAGQAAVVGERGPELIVPRRDSTVIPNHALGGGAPVFNVDMRGASLEAVQDLRRLVIQVNGSIEQRAVTAVSSERARDPGLFA